MNPATALFRKHYGHPPIHVVRAPGRLELLGNHTDYNEGLVLALAVDQAVTITSAPRLDGRIELVSSAFDAKETFFAHDLTKKPAAPWADYLKGVLEQLRRRHIHFGGFNAAIHSTLPLGAGLGSSAALAVATVLTIRQLTPFILTATGASAPPTRDKKGALPPLTAAEKIAAARLCQAAENQFVGVNCGLLDPLASLFGLAGHAIEIDCQSLTVEHVPLAGEAAIVVCPSGVKHELVAGEYNARRQHCASAARTLGVKSLRTVDAKFLAANQSRLAGRDYQCACHVVGETQRVVFGARALRVGDFWQFGQFMFQSHESSRDLFQNSCAELDLLVDLARAQPGCLGARLTGGGFGGSTINLVERGRVPAFIESIASQFEQRLGYTIEPKLCEIADGAR